jgi:phage shock protein A
VSGKDGIAETMYRYLARIHKDAEDMAEVAVRVGAEHAELVDLLRSEVRARDEEIAKLNAALEGAERVIAWWQQQHAALARRTDEATR